MNLKASYINKFLIGALISIFIAFALSLVIPTLIALVIGVTILIIMFLFMLFYSKTYGEKGFSKKIADSSKPNHLKRINNYKSCMIWIKQ